jgi:hypothetical protein
MRKAWLISALALVIAPAAQAARPPQGAPTGYARVHGACQAPRAGHASCFALVRTPASAAEAARPGVERFELRDGAASAGPAGGLTPAELAGAYGYDPDLAPPTAQTIAIVDAFNDPAIESDLGKFDSQYGLPECTEADRCFEKVGQSGTATLPGDDEAGWSAEIALDVEVAHSTCRQCKILLVEADSSSFADLGAAVDTAVGLGATEVSNSYGGPEGEFSEAADYEHPGVVISAATGDTGFNGWLDEDFPDRPNIPAAIPAVVAVGGTTLELAEDGARASETVWNGNGRFDELEFSEGATGGGCSTTFTAQPWQLDASGFAATGCAAKRSATDVAADANPLTGFDIYDSYNCGKECERFKAKGTEWLTIGGTSLATPLISALYGLSGGSDGVSDPALTLYGHLGEPAAAFDVSQGGNGFCDDEGSSCGIDRELEEYFAESGWEVDCEGTTACNAAPGFDGPSGVGSPNSLALFEPRRPLAVIAPPAKALAGVAADFGGAASSDPYPGGAPLTYSWNWGDGSPAGTGSESSHSYLQPGRYTVTLTVTDAYGIASAAAVTEVLVAERTATELEAEAAAKRKASEEAAAVKKQAETAAAAGARTGVSAFKARADPDVTLERVRAKVGATGKLVLTVECPAGETGCAGTITLAVPASVDRGNHRSVAIARASFALAGGRQEAVTLRLSRGARALLRRTGLLRVRAMILASDPAGARHRTVLVVVLRAIGRS